MHVPLAVKILRFRVNQQLFDTITIVHIYDVNNVI